jgi:2-methylisocitrate lyase-like PEP mutase family enzyme
VSNLSIQRPIEPGGSNEPEEKAARLAALHVKGAPLQLFNVRDAGSAKSILDARAKAIATPQED